MIQQLSFGRLPYLGGHTPSSNDAKQYPRGNNSTPGQLGVPHRHSAGDSNHRRPPEPRGEQGVLDAPEVKLNLKG